MEPLSGVPELTPVNPKGSYLPKVYPPHNFGNRIANLFYCKAGGSGDTHSSSGARLRFPAVGEPLIKPASSGRRQAGEGGGEAAENPLATQDLQQVVEAGAH